MSRDSKASISSMRGRCICPALPTTATARPIAEKALTAGWSDSSYFLVPCNYGRDCLDELTQHIRNPTGEIVVKGVGSNPHENAFFVYFLIFANLDAL